MPRVGSREWDKRCYGSFPSNIISFKVDFPTPGLPSRSIFFPIKKSRFLFLGFHQLNKMNAIN